MNDPVGERVAQLASGDRRAVHVLLEQYLPELRAFLRLRMGPRMAARETGDDLAQSVCREVLADLDGAFVYRGEREFKSWLFLQAHRKLVDRARFYEQQRRAADREFVALDADQVASGYRAFASPSGVAMRNEEIEHLERAFAQLPDDYREVISCARILGMTHDEIAVRLGRTVVATRALLHRAMVRLAFLLESNDGSASR